MFHFDLASTQAGQDLIAIGEEKGEKRGEERGIKQGEERGIKKGMKQGEISMARTLVRAAYDAI